MFRTTLWFVLAPLLAWSAPWTCSPIVTPVGPIPTSSGGLTQVDAGVVLVYSPVPGAGFPGLMAGPTGGITVGSGAAFNSDFVYNANHSDGTISRILIPPGGVSPPYEEARYFGIVPVNNHFHTYNAALGQGSNWSAAGVDQLDPTQSPNLWVAPSRSVVDRNGNAWVTLRASNWSIDWQAGVTKIINVDDNATNPSPELGCVPRCHHRQNLATDTIFTEGLPMSLASGGAVILSPVARPGTTVVTGPPGTTGGVIIPGSSAAQAYVCLDSGLHNYLDENDPTNYDDCVRYSIALGDPQPDLEADALGQTSGAHLGRGTALAPNCDPTNTNKECDLWLDLYNGNAALVHLSFDGTNAKPQPLNPTWTSAPYDVSVVHHPGYPGYGLTVDCAGIVWTSKAGIGEVTGTTSVPINDFIVTGGGWWFRSTSPPTRSSPMCSPRAARSTASPTRSTVDPTAWRVTRKRVSGSVPIITTHRAPREVGLSALSMPARC